MVHKRYFIVRAGDIGEKTARLRGEEYHHLAKVLRIREGERVRLLDGDGGLYESSVSRYENGEAILDLLSTSRPPRPRPVDLALPLFKAGRMDAAVEKCGELGVRAIIPFRSERSIWKEHGGDKEKKLERLRRKIESACKQAGQPYFPRVEDIVHFKGLISMIPLYPKVFLADGEFGGGPDFTREDPKRPLLGIVGPEGGLTDEEREMILRSGAEALSLGNSRLRSETAAICLSFLLLSR